jgi:ribosomal protein S18 acetylase RimI-like enzyme
LIREFRYPDDLEEAIALMDECGLIRTEGDIVRDEITRKLSKDPRLFLVYEVDGRIVGSVIGGWDGWRGWIYKLGVSAKHRRMGIGTALVDEVVKRLQELGARRIGASAVPTNVASISLFKKNGFMELDAKFLRLQV